MQPLATRTGAANKGAATASTEAAAGNTEVGTRADEAAIAPDAGAATATRSSAAHEKLGGVVSSAGNEMADFGLITGGVVIGLVGMHFSEAKVTLHRALGRPRFQL